MAQLKFILLLYFLKCVAALRTDISEKQEALYCEHRKHTTFKPSATCCANQVVKPGIDTEGKWKSCTKSIKDKSDNLINTSWDMFACILKKSGAKDPITLQDFATLINDNYPDDIKSKINDEIKSVQPPIREAALGDYEKLEKIRVTYYDIETEVCSGMSSETKSYGKIEACSSWKEENHRAGMCCKRSFPVDIRFKSLLDLNNDEGAKEYCRKDFTPLNATMNITETMQENLLDICDLACAMKKMKILPDLKAILYKQEYWHFDINSIFTAKMLPDFIPSNLVQEAIEYANSTFSYDATIAAMKNYTFADIIPGDSNTFRISNYHTYIKVGNKSAGDKFATEFMDRYWHKGIIHVPIICSAYREILTLMEYYIFKNCAAEDVTEAPIQEEPSVPVTEAPAPEPEQSPTDAPVSEAPAAE